ncbi:MAG: pectate lyase [Planctomycetales bacterium]|nr:pectate lyase [Planctomycetales bacterium]
MVSRKQLLIVFTLALSSGSATALGQVRFSENLLKRDTEWFRSDEARAIADSVLQYQSPQGGWPKNTDLSKPLRSPDDVPAANRANSFDNGATTLPLRFLARIATTTGDPKYRDSFLRGFDYVLAAQYPNGGWPQFWPLRKGYYSHITYNDGAMIRVMEIVRDVAKGEAPYQFVDAERRTKASEALHRGIDCILKTQIRQNGMLTAWCAQHDVQTLKPAWARAYEPPSLSGGESVGIVVFLMKIEEPSEEIVAAIEGVVVWLRSVQMNGIRVSVKENTGRRRDRQLVPDAQAPPLWARFYELNTNRPLYLDRDSVFRYDFSEISYERRSGYAYHGTWASSLLETEYPRWRSKNKLAQDKSSKQRGALAGERHRVIVSTDIGGTDPDDFQSMVHLLLYSDVLDIEGLIASPYGQGRATDILAVIDCYEKDFASLKTYSDNYPTPDALRAITKQGETERAPYGGFRKPTDGSNWIIECARRDDPRPLQVLIWGGIEDLAQALHDAPDILTKLRVYWIGGPNKKWAPDAFQYIVAHHPNLWMIESNATYRGWFTGGNQSGQWGNEEFVSRHVKGKGSLGDFFVSKKADIKMGDTPSLGWLLKGSPGDPTKAGWGGSYVRAWERPHLQLDRLPTSADQIEVFGILDLALPINDAQTNSESILIVENQKLVGHVANDSTMRFRFCPKAAKQYNFTIESNVRSLDGQTGAITAVLPSPEIAKLPTPKLPNWWTDDPSPELAEGQHAGAKTVSQWREEFLSDFAKRMLRAKEPFANRTDSQ